MNHFYFILVINKLIHLLIISMKIMLPDEVWLIILDLLNGRDLTCTLLTCQLYQRLIVDNDIMNKRKYFGFPRVEKCKLYKINIKNNINMMCNYVYENNDDIPIRGDIIYAHDNFYVFDGIKLITCLLHQQHYVHDSFVLPKEFAINNHNIPIDYWFKMKKELYEFLHFKDIREIHNYVWVESNFLKNNIIQTYDYNFKSFKYITLSIRHGNINYALSNVDIHDDMVLIYQNGNQYDIHEYKQPDPPPGLTCIIL